MDPATLIGLLLAFGAMFTMIIMEGASITSILLPAPMIIVFVGTLAVGLASGTIQDTLSAIKMLPKAFRGKLAPVGETIDKLVDLATVARKDGLLALEAEGRDIKDPFLSRSLQSLADGMDGDELNEQLEDDISSKERADAVGYKWFNTLGGYAPTVGIIGTVVSLTHVLENLSKPDELGHMIAAAFVATLWGLVSSNFIWLPIGARLRRLSDIEVQQMNVVMEGVLAIQSGIQPLLLDEKLRSMLPPSASGKKGKKQTLAVADEPESFEAAA